MMSACLGEKNRLEALWEAANNQSILLTNQQLHFRLSLSLMFKCEAFPTVAVFLL